jgi:hypothetical protein
MKRRVKRRAKGRCSRPAKTARQRLWAAFRRKYVKPGMSKAAYRAAVKAHWRPASTEVRRFKKKCQAKGRRRVAPKRRLGAARRPKALGMGRRRKMPKRNSKGRFVKA